MCYFHEMNDLQSQLLMTNEGGNYEKNDFGYCISCCDCRYCNNNGMHAGG